MGGLAQESGNFSLPSIQIPSGRKFSEGFRGGDEGVVGVKPRGVTARIVAILEHVIENSLADYATNIAGAGAGGGTLALAAGTWGTVFRVVAAKAVLAAT